MSRTVAGSECPNDHGPDGLIACWSPGGPCPDGQTVCETCGPCQWCIASLGHTKPRTNGMPTFVVRIQSMNQSVNSPPLQARATENSEETHHPDDCRWWGHDHHLCDHCHDDPPKGHQCPACGAWPVNP